MAFEHAQTCFENQCKIKQKHSEKKRHDHRRETATITAKDAWGLVKKPFVDQGLKMSKYKISLRTAQQTCDTLLAFLFVTVRSV